MVRLAELYNLDELLGWCSMTWIEPKTDWTENSFFNIEDYNRIINNLYYLRNLSIEIMNHYNIKNMDEKNSYANDIYAREINAIEDNLESINMSTYKFDIGKKTIYRDNGPTPLWSEFNRIESAVFLLHKTMVAHKNSLNRLSFTLGGEKGIRV